MTMIRKETLFFMLLVIVIGSIAVLFFKRGVSSDPCETHRELFLTEIDSGRVTDKYIDQENHAIKTIILSVNKESYEIQFIPYDNWTDFDKIRINDLVKKPSNSFLFSINHDYTFLLMLDCEYSVL